ncbi:MAG: hypothetical protein ACU837_05025 [Gammaproteobacteria bacterium]
MFSSNFSYTAELVSALSNPGLQPAWSNAGYYADQVNQQGKSIVFYSIGQAYDAHGWNIQAELGYLDSEWVGFRSLVSGYLSVGRRFDDVTPYAVFSFAQNTGDPETPVPPEIPGIFQDQVYAYTSNFM